MSQLKTWCGISNSKFNRPVVVMPWDRHIAAGTEISLDLLDPIYKRKVLELAAALSDDFERAGRR